MFTKSKVLKYMQQRKLEYLPIIYKEEDKLGMLIHVTPAGKMVDAHAKNVSAKTLFWGYVAFEAGKPVRRKFE